MFEKLSKTDLKVLRHISKKPYEKFYLRQIAKELKISTSSTKKAIDSLINLNLLKSETMGNLRIVYGNMEEILFKNYKILENISFLKDLIDQLKPAISITLYGSYAKGENDSQSDIDIVLITNNKNKTPTVYKDEELQIKKFTPKEWKDMKKTNKAYVNDVSKGITLYGEKII